MPVGSRVAPSRIEKEAHPVGDIADSLGVYAAMSPKNCDDREARGVVARSMNPLTGGQLFGSRGTSVGYLIQVPLRPQTLRVCVSCDRHNIPSVTVRTTLG
jgi:hypothetical protein